MRKRVGIDCQETVKSRIPVDRCTQEGGCCPKDGLIVNQNIQVVFCIRLGSFVRKRIAEQLEERRILLEFGRLGCQHPVCIQQQESQVLLGGITEWVKPSARGIRFACKATQQKPIIEREADHARGLPAHTVQGIKSARPEKGIGKRQLFTACRGGYLYVPRQRDW